MSKCVCYRQIVCKLFYTASLFPYNKCERTQRVLNEWLALAQACINFGRVRMMIQGLFTTLTEICVMDHKTTGPVGLNVKVLLCRATFQPMQSFLAQAGRLHHLLLLED